MADPYQPINVNTGSAQSAIQATPVITPNLQNLVQGVTSGMISIADLQKRGMDLPLESAQRTQDIADVSQLRPLQREAATAQLENVRAKQQFEAESLPILNDTKREALQQEYQNVLQHGVPAAVMKTFNQVVPGFVEYDSAKLFPKQGGLNTAYALEIMGKAFEKAEKIKKFQTVKPTTITNVSSTGEKSTFEQLIDPVSGQPLGAKIPTGVAEVNAAEVAAKDTAAKASLSNDVLKERNSSDLIKRFIPQAGAFQAIDEIRYRDTPPRNSDDLAILYEFVKVLDPTSVVREGEKKFAESTAPGVQALWNKVQGLWSDSNKTMDPDTRANLFKTVDTLRSAAEKQAIPEIKRISNLAIDRGMPLSQAFTEPELKLLINGPTVPGRPSPAVIGATPAATGTPAVPAGDNPVVSLEQARTLPDTVKFFRLTPGGPLKWNSNHPDSPAQQRLRAGTPVTP